MLGKGGSLRSRVLMVGWGWAFFLEGEFDAGEGFEAGVKLFAGIVALYDDFDGKADVVACGALSGSPVGVGNIELNEQGFQVRPRLLF